MVGLQQLQFLLGDIDVAVHLYQFFDEVVEYLLRVFAILQLHHDLAYSLHRVVHDEDYDLLEQAVELVVVESVDCDAA